MAQTIDWSLELAQASQAGLIARMSRDHIEHGLPWRWREGAIRALISAPDCTVLLAKGSLQDRDFAAGFAAMDFKLEHATLNLMAVHPSVRGRGVAKRMLRWLQHSADVAGIESIRLQVRMSNHAAINLYRQLGYRSDKVVAGYYRGYGEHREDALQMILRLRPSYPL